MNRKIRTYTELIQLPTFSERFEYLKLTGDIGIETFGFDRYLNQNFYKSKEWQSVRREVILRDNACDLGIPGFDIYTHIIVHHMNPLTIDDVNNKSEVLLNPEYLVTVSLRTHNDIHFGKSNYTIEERRAGDTIPWKKF